MTELFTYLIIICLGKRYSPNTEMDDLNEVRPLTASRLRFMLQATRRKRSTLSLLQCPRK